MDDYGSDSPARDPAPRKRARVQLSCTECRRRKIACTKDTPCGPCVKRNQADLCHTESSKPSEPPLSGTEQRSLATRLHALETVLFAAQPDLKLAFAQALSSEDATPPSISNSPQSMPVAPKINQIPVPLSSRFTAPPNIATVINTEDAAAVLENLAFHAKARHSPQNPVASSSKGSGLYPSIVNKDCLADADAVLAPVKESLVRSLPPANIVFRLVAFYFDELAWNSRVLCRPQFEADLKEFFELQSAGLVNQVDSAWLAVLFAVLAMAIPSSAEKGKLDVKAIGESSGAAAGAKFYRRSTHFFELADAHEKPQFRGLQALALYIVHLGTVDRDNSGHLPHLGWMVLACKHAQVMGLFDLGDDSESMPPADRAFPSRPSALARQMACRVIWTFLFYDALQTGKLSALPCDFPVTTPRPFNINDRDLGFDTNVSDSPLTVPTDTVFEVAKSAVTRMNRRLAVLTADKITVDDALELTRQLHESNIDFGTSVPLALQLHCQTMQCVIHHTTLRLHRPWFQKALDPAYKASAELCIHSAIGVIQAFKNVTTILNGPSSRFWLLPMHVLSAVVVLAVTLLSLPQDHPTVSHIWQHIANAQETLNIHSTSVNTAVSRTATRAYQTVNAIIERQRRFSPSRTGNFEKDASKFLQLVSEDLKAPYSTDSTAGVSNASTPGHHQGPDLASIATSKQENLYSTDALPYVPLDPTWILEDQNFDWIPTGLGQF